MDLRELKQIAIEQDRLYRESCMEKRDLPELVSQWEYAVHVMPMQMVALVDHVTELENRVNGMETENAELREALKDVLLQFKRMTDGDAPLWDADNDPEYDRLMALTVRKGKGDE
ncbi:hypothetical protein [Terasakiella sp.]|uniref:hypothetical protein n=1 Tax=Terasakiella sp. TaxID=2034861 RepID=UPI003AA86E65